MMKGGGEFPGVKALAVPKEIAALATPKRIQRRGAFIRGPIPLRWMTEAAGLGDATLRTGLALWFLRGVNRSPTVKLTTHAIQLFGVSQASKPRALLKLESAGLVVVERRAGANPIVTLVFEIR